jgi:hypothetical protein
MIDSIDGECKDFGRFRDRFEASPSELRGQGGNRKAG